MSRCCCAAGLGSDVGDGDKANMASHGAVPADESLAVSLSGAACELALCCQPRAQQQISQGQ